MERRCELLGVPRANYYRGPASGLRNGDLELMRRIDELYTQHPWMGSRSLADHLASREAPVGRDRVRRLMLVMGIQSLSPKPGTSKRQPRHPVYPYLLRGMTIDKPNQVWATDITYIPMARGFMYLIAIMDWATRKVLSWRLPTRWTPDSASRRSKKPYSHTALRKSSTPTRDASSPVKHSPPSSRSGTSRSAWTARGGSKTTFSSNGSGAP